MAHPRLLTQFIPIWKEAPILRLLVPLMLGISLQWYLPQPFLAIVIFAAISFLSIVIFHFAKSRRVYFSSSLYLLMAVLGAALVWLNNTTHQPNYIGKHYRDSAVVVATLQEPLVEKIASYKAEATVSVLQNGNLISTAGRIVIYFKKDSVAGKPPLDYGS